MNIEATLTALAEAITDAGLPATAGAVPDVASFPSAMVLLPEVIEYQVASGRDRAVVPVLIIGGPTAEPADSQATLCALLSRGEAGNIVTALSGLRIGPGIARATTASDLATPTTIAGHEYLTATLNLDLII